MSPRNGPKALYGLVDPRDGVVRYVGASANPQKRYVQHIAQEGAPPRQLRAWLDGLGREGLKPDLRLFTGPIEDWRRQERLLQRKHGATLYDKAGKWEHGERKRGEMRSFVARNLGDHLRSVRESHGLTQTAAADVLSVSPSTVSRWESGSRTPDLADIFYIANAYGVAAHELLPEGGANE